MFFLIHWQRFPEVVNRKKKEWRGDPQRFIEGDVSILFLGGLQVGFLCEFTKVHVDRSAAEIKSSQTSHRDVWKGGDDWKGKMGGVEWCEGFVGWVMLWFPQIWTHGFFLVEEMVFICFYIFDRLILIINPCQKSYLVGFVSTRPRNTLDLSMQGRKLQVFHGKAFYPSFRGWAT